MLQLELLIDRLETQIQFVYFSFKGPPPSTEIPPELADWFTDFDGFLFQATNRALGRYVGRALGRAMSRLVDGALDRIIPLTTGRGPGHRFNRGSSRGPGGGTLYDLGVFRNLQANRSDFTVNRSPKVYLEPLKSHIFQQIQLLRRLSRIYPTKCIIV